MIDLKRPNGMKIEKWDDWTRPKRDYQWKAGRSAMELAKAWFRDGLLSPPYELIEVLESEPRLNGLQLLKGIPELVTLLPERGEGRNHDLVLHGQTTTEKVTICVEAKADEPFGTETVLTYWNRAMRRRSNGESTRVPERIQALLGIIGEPDHTLTESQWGAVRYQLLTAICGTVLQAEVDSSTLAVLIVHEFHTALTLKANLDKNHNDFNKLLSVLTAKSIVSDSNKLYGPFKFRGIDCFIGKVVA